MKLKPTDETRATPPGRRSLFALAVVAVLGIAGCLYSDMHLRLRYGRYRRVSAPPNDVTIAVGAFTDSRRVVELGRIYDLDQQVRGIVYADNDVGAWVRDALMKELVAEGFNVVSDAPSDDALPPATGLSVDGRVVEVTAHREDAVSARIGVLFVARRRGAPFLKQVYEASGGVPTPIGAPQEFEAALNQTLTKVVKRFIFDLRRYVEDRPGPRVKTRS